MDFDKSPLPLVVAVVGHRDPIPDLIPKLRKNFRDHLKKITRELPSTPIYMLNGLARGMDTEAAEVFLEVISEQKETTSKNINHKLIATLPKSVESYISSFSSQEEAQRLKALLSKCSAVLDPTNSKGLRGASSNNKEQPSPFCYIKQGVFLVRHSLLLFAFYDGIEVFEKGGTCQSVAMQKGDYPKFSLSLDELLNSKNNGCLVEYYTPRRRHSSLNNYSTRLTCNYWKNKQKILERKVVNENDITYLLDTPKQIIEEINKNLTTQSFNSYEDNESQTALRSFACKKAKRFKGKDINSGWIWLFLGWFITISLAQPPYQLYGLLFFSLFLIFNPTPSKYIKNNFIKYRALVEALDIQEIGLKLGIDLDTADSFHIHQDLKLDWVRSILLARRIHLKAIYANKSPNIEQISSEIQRWLGRQVEWLEKRVKEYGKSDMLLKNLIKLFLTLSIMCASLALIPGLEDKVMWFTEICIASFFWLLAYREILIYNETKERYSRSLEIYKKLLVAIDQSEEEESYKIKEIFKMLKREKFDELNDWIANQTKRYFTPAR